jgi:hypothetical protein
LILLLIKLHLTTPPFSRKPLQEITSCLGQILATWYSIHLWAAVQLPKWLITASGII